MRLSQSDLNTIRQHPQQTKLFLSIFRPSVVFKARVNGAITRGERHIPFDTVTVGSYTNLRAGMTILVGSSDGARDKGKVRLRSASSIELLVAENSDINWADDLYITGLNFFEVWPVYPRIIHDPLNAESVVFYKDYDIAYTNQNTILGTFVNAGSHRMIFRDCASGIAETYWSSTGTLGLRTGTSFAYNWSFEGGSPSSSTSRDPGLVQYSAPGHYVTSLTVSGSLGSVDTTYRYVSVYDYPGCGTGTPPLNWELTSLDGSRSEGGYTVGITLREIIDINEGDVVVIFAEDWYGNTKQSFGGNYPNSASILFAGYVLDDSIRMNYRSSTVEFQAGSISQMMKQGEGFSCSVESKIAPSTWFELLDMDVRRAVYHYLRWHTTVLNVADVQFLGTDQKIQFFDADRGSLYDAIDSLIRSALVGSVVSDRQSKLWLEIDAHVQPNATGTFIPIMDLDKGDWVNEPRIDEALSNTMSFVELGGIAYSGVQTGTFAPLLSNAPGNAPSYRGKVERTQGLALLDQAHLNEIAGNIFAFKNAKYPIIDEEMSGNYRNLDIAPQEVVFVDIPAEENMRGKRIFGLYTPIAMTWNWDSKSQVLTPRTTFNIVTTGEPGETIAIPDIPPGDGFNNIPVTPSPTFPGTLFPSFNFPSVSGTWGQIHYFSPSSTTTIENGVIRTSAYDTSDPATNELTVLSAGTYIVYGDVTGIFSATDDRKISASIYINNTSDTRFSNANSNTGNSVHSISVACGGLTELNENDIVKLLIQGAPANSATFTSFCLVVIKLS